MSKTSHSASPRRREGKSVRSADGAAHDAYGRHLLGDHLVTSESASPRERFEAVVRSLRDVLAPRWLLTQQTQDRENPKRVYYLSMEFLMGRALVNNVINLGAEQLVRDALGSDAGRNWT